MEEYFMRIVEESKLHPGRRYVPGSDNNDKPQAAPPLTTPKQGEVPTSSTDRR